MPTLNRGELADLNVFVALVRRRSFRQAAIELGVTTSALSHALRQLETRLGVKLLNRTSRSVVPTLAGAALAEKLEQGFALIGEALGELDQHRDAPVGRLRLSVPRDAARLLLTPTLPRLLAAYPQLQLDISVEDRPVDIVADGLDAGIRYGDTVPQDMVALPLTDELRWIVVGAPAYLDRHGRPQQPEELAEHRCVRLRLGNGALYRWELGSGATTRTIDVPGPLTVNETETSIQVALDGLALAYCLEWRVADELRDGRLEQVLPDWTSPGAPLCIYYPSRRQPPPGLRQLIEALRQTWTGRHP
ncbi:MULTISPECIES: LysR family transcriptional regulator [Pseudomonas]|jgi:DNA-binding transcriptional LysR family regulator|uniref:LysR family transcriptional regulator n=1 Tax=Pseudomonas flavocrustae TaxID=2991719 RepID=A0ABT6IGE0_9PSED|nr:MULTISPECIES: LysR family transcriptional regulator [unclassified Pseudomonas]MDH4763547.1 LysR family transcriptional regulator [Pseudomonas sp. CBMAI 2609]